MSNPTLNALRAIYNELQNNGWRSDDILMAENFLVLSREFYSINENRLKNIDATVKSYLHPDVVIGIKPFGAFGEACYIFEGPYVLILQKTKNDSEGLIRAQEGFKKIKEVFENIATSLDL